MNRDRGDGLGELDYSYIGRYHCASGYKSTTGAAQQVNITRSQARTGIHNLGANFWQMDFAQFWYVNMLFLVEFADWNGERIGRGCSTNGSKMNNGQTDAMGYHTSTTAASRDSYGFTQYRNIEGWWDNVYDWMDGCYYNNNGLNVISNPNNFSDSANGTLVGTPSSGYPSDFTIPTASGLEWALFPSAANGSQTTYVPDYWNFNGSRPCLYHGGDYNRNQYRGPFCVYYDSSSSSSSDIGCRLQERPPQIHQSNRKDVSSASTFSLSQDVIFSLQPPASCSKGEEKEGTVSGSPLLRVLCIFCNQVFYQHVFVLLNKSFYTGITIS